MILWGVILRLVFHEYLKTPYTSEFSWITTLPNSTMTSYSDSKNHHKWDLFNSVWGRSCEKRRWPTSILAFGDFMTRWGSRKSQTHDWVNSHFTFDLADKTFFFFLIFISTWCAFTILYCFAIHTWIHHGVKIFDSQNQFTWLTSRSRYDGSCWQQQSYRWNQVSSHFTPALFNNLQEKEWRQ